GAQAKLTGTGPDIVGAIVSVTPPSTLTAVFNLQGVSTGTRDLVITNPNGTTATLNNTFTVDQGGAPSLSVDLLGRGQIRDNISSANYLEIANPGNVDLYDIAVFVSVPQTLQLDFGCFEPSLVDLHLHTDSVLSPCAVPGSAQIGSRIETPL